MKKIFFQSLTKLALTILFFGNFSVAQAARMTFSKIGNRGLQTCMNQAMGRVTAASRDDDKILCLSSFQKSMTLSTCLSVAKSFEYGTNSDKARSFCMFELKERISAETCVNETRKFQYTESANEARWRCLLTQTKNLSTTQCRALAKDMTIPALQDRAEEYCTMIKSK